MLMKPNLWYQLIYLGSSRLFKMNYVLLELRECNKIKRVNLIKKTNPLAPFAVSRHSSCISQPFHVELYHAEMITRWLGGQFSVDRSIRWRSRTLFVHHDAGRVSCIRNLFVQFSSNANPSIFLVVATVAILTYSKRYSFYFSVYTSR